MVERADRQADKQTDRQAGRQTTGESGRLQGCSGGSDPAVTRSLETKSQEKNKLLPLATDGNHAYLCLLNPISSVFCHESQTQVLEFHWE